MLIERRETLQLFCALAVTTLRLSRLLPFAGLPIATVRATVSFPIVTDTLFDAV
jgi:hypothetical protein